MTRAEQFAKIENLVVGQPHKYDTSEENFWDDGTSGISLVLDENGRVDRDLATPENTFDVVMQSEAVFDDDGGFLWGPEQPQNVVRWELEDGSAIIIKENNWWFGLSADEIAEPTIRQRVRAKTGDESRARFVNRETLQEVP